MNSDAREDCIVIERDGVTAGLRRMEWHDLADGDRLYDATLLVAPGVWGHGSGEAVVAWGEERRPELAAANPTDRRAWYIGQYLFDGDTSSRPSLEDAATSRPLGRRDAPPDMARPSVPALPEGYRVRSPRGRAARGVRDDVEAFQEHWGETEETEDAARGLDREPALPTRPARSSWRGGEPVAVVSVEARTTPTGARGLLDAVATTPATAASASPGRRSADSLRLLRDAGATRPISAWTPTITTGRSALYETCGFRKVSGSTACRRPFTGEEPRP